MLKKENRQLLKSLKIINKETEKVFYLLNDLLERPDKDYTVTFGDEKFELGPTFDFDEAVDMAHTRLNLINLLLQDCFSAYIRMLPINNEAELNGLFSPIIAFTLGPDPKHCKVNKKYKPTPYLVPAEKSKALNMSSYYVQNDLQGEHVKAD